MDSTLALALCTIFVMTLLILERRSSGVVSYAVWLPTAWVLVAASRPLTTWSAPVGLSVEETAEAGSALDRLVLSILIALATVVLLRRRVNWLRLGKENVWLLILFAYMAASITWSEFPLVSFKRWVRTLGPLMMAALIVSDRIPLQAFEAVFRRTAYILVPFSLLLIKYYPPLGVEYNRWSGQLMWTGVTSNKNSLGQLCAVSLLLLLWMTLRSRRAGELKDRVLQSADLLVGAIALFLLRGAPGAYSATSFALLAVGSMTLLLVYKFNAVATYVARHLGALIAVGVLVFWMLNQWLMNSVSSMLGRDATLTGRTDIWQGILAVASGSPVIGVGYGGFWGLQPEITSAWGVTQSHNGYLNVYLELGIVGLLLFGIYVFSLCARIRRVLAQSIDLGALSMCCLLLTLLYNISESALLTTGFLWTTMVIASVLTTAASKDVSLARVANEQSRPMPYRQALRERPGVTDKRSGASPVPVGGHRRYNRDWQRRQDGEAQTGRRVR